MKRFILLLPLCVHGFWCETNNRTGCRGQSRHFVREASAQNPFLPFQDIKVAAAEDPIVVDWDMDGDLDVIVRTVDLGLLLFEFKSDSNHFVKVEPSPFKEIFAAAKIGKNFCRPAVVDWNGDGRLDLIIGTQDGIKYYEKHTDGRLYEKADNPFERVHTRRNGCNDLAVADWDGNGKLDLLVSDSVGSSYPMQHYEESDGQLVLVDASTGPFRYVKSTSAKRPLMADWDGDGRTDLILMAKAFDRASAPGIKHCPVEVHMQGANGRASVYDSSDTVLQNWGCTKFDGSGISLVDVDDDGDLDAIMGAKEGPLHVYERTSAGLKLPTVEAASSGPIPLDQIQLDTTPDGLQWNGRSYNHLHPLLVDWDLDGDLDLAMVDADLGSRPWSLIYPKDKNSYFEHQADGTVLKLSAPPNISCPLDWRKHFSYVDFDGDGKKDIVGFDSEADVIICLQTFSGYVLSGQNPFKRSDSIILACRNCPWDNEFSFFHWGTSGFPSFLDWDADGDLDMLRINEAKQVYLYEQLSNGSFFAQPLRVPPARDYTAADFDGDGDVDLMMTKPNGDSCLYFERRSDGSLEQLFGTDNPFKSVCEVVRGDTIASAIEPDTLSTLGDWNGDGEIDMITVGNFKVNLWTNQPRRTFMEVIGSEQPFTPIDLSEKTAVSLADANGDGRLDVVIPPQVFDMHGIETYLYFEQRASGKVVKQQGSSNPFDKVREMVGLTSELEHQRKNLVVDVDGDGDLDIVVANLQYIRNDNGTFTAMRSYHPSSPFYGIDDSDYSYWTLVDWDGDQKLDLVQAYKPEQTQAHGDWMNREIMAMMRNGTSRADRLAWLQKVSSPRMRFYQQVRIESSGITFVELTGSANPFHDMTANSRNPMIELGYSPGVIDLDGDGDLDLVLGTPKGKLRYFEQHDGKFREPAINPFAELSLYSADGTTPVQPRFVDWDGDGALDLVVTGTQRVQYFQRGVCMPSSPFCRAGSCDKDTSRCKCSPGAEGDDCSLCGDFHVREQGVCRPCPGFGDLSSFTGTCNRRGVCQDDVDARAEKMASNHSGFKVASATGTGQCNCSHPFSGDGCEKVSCGPGQRLVRTHMDTNQKYPVWETCVPCQSDRFKNFSGNQESCSFCPDGHIPEQGLRCLPCGAGKVPNAKNRSECRPCPVGFVAASGAALCRPCPAGTAPSDDGSVCVQCEAGAVARPRSGQCTLCPEGSAPQKTSKSECRDCEPQSYALEGDETCKPCTFPAMILNDNNWCTSLYTVLFILAFLLFMLLVLAVLGRLRLHCLKKRLNNLVAAKNWPELYSTQTTLLEYGLWNKKARATVQDCKLQVEKTSFQLGISLRYVFEHLEDVYKEKAQQAEWRLDEWGPVTKSGFLVKVRNCKLQVDPLAAWNALEVCDYPKDPNFHQVAGVLAYGPWALGKHQCCPRDGLPDCSIVDALQVESNSAKATWFLSWVWGYHFSTMTKALSRWWEKHKIVSGLGEDASGEGTYIWWCVFVNNQFRMLEAGIVEDAGDLFNVFGQQLEGIGKMLMCLDKMKGSSYTTRIWCIFEVFVACQRSIPTTVILPEVEVDAVTSLKDLTTQCKVDAEQAKASVEDDAVAIKKHIQKEHKSFEYVNQTVEQALWCEVIKVLEQSEPSEMSKTGSTVASTESKSDISIKDSHRTVGSCNLQ